MSTSNEPLWQKIVTAFDTSFDYPSGAAAVLRVIADEVVPMEIAGYQEVVDADCRERFIERQRIRQRLLAEAERAEAGQ